MSEFKVSEMMHWPSSMTTSPDSKRPRANSCTKNGFPGMLLKMDWSGSLSWRLAMPSALPAISTHSAGVKRLREMRSLQ